MSVCTEMASASFSSDVLQEFYEPQAEASEALEVFDGRALLTEEEFLENLTKAIQRKNHGKAAKKIREKLLKGWKDIHEEIKNMPYCELQDQATKVFLCLKCNSCGITGMCVACNKRKIFHSLLDREEAWKLEASGVKTWY